MKKFTNTVVCTIFLLAGECAAPNDVTPSLNKLLSSRIQFADLEKAKALLTTEDDFTSRWSQFDIDARLQKNNGTKEELLAFIASQTLAWSDSEKIALIATVRAIDADIMQNAFLINFPDTIFLVKTTTEEEGGASSYTRANYIVVSGGWSNKGLLIHELYDIVSRHDADFRREMHKIIGFTVIDEVPVPDEIRRITNPDSPKNDSYITLVKDGVTVDCMMILFSTGENGAASLFGNLQSGFLLLTGSSVKTAAYIDNAPVIYERSELSNFIPQIGENTLYRIQPEEILASNFVFAIENKRGLRSQWVVDGMQNLLRNKEKSDH